MFACSYCVSVSSPEWWTTAALGRGIVAVLAGLVLVVVAIRSVGRRRLGASLAALGLLVALPLAVLLGGITTTTEVVTERSPSGTRGLIVSCSTAFRSSASTNSLGEELEQACHDATAVRRAAVLGVAALGAVAILVGGALMTLGSRSRRTDPVPA
ncbi:MAG: hypothetical protein M3Y51_05290 [Actinomycetota bacterium]|nr:hypothetical protein [Actinomycetota bacterium]